MIEVIARAAVVVDKQALLVRAKGAANTFLPGGHVEVGESVVSALRRELHEEMGAACVVGGALGVVENEWHDDVGRVRHEINHVFAVTLRAVDPATLVSREENLELLWCPLVDLDERNVLPSPMRAILRLAAEGDVGAAFASTLRECTFETPQPCEVRRVRANDVVRLRAARLYALAETPTAFGATLARDLAQSHDRWLAWAQERDFDAKPDTTPTRRATFVADDGDRLRGMVTIAEGNDDSTRAHVFAMWVHPTHRARSTPEADTGLAQRMLDAAITWAREQGFARVSLAVTTNNTRARRLYERRGFLPTGNTWPLQHTPSLLLHEMMFTLT